MKNIGLNFWVTIIIILMILIPIWTTTHMVQNDIVYINIYMKLKFFFQFKQRFCYLYILCIIYIIYIYYIYIICYVNTIYITLYILYICQEAFPYWGIGGNPPTSQKFADSPCTWNNFFLHQKLVLSLLNNKPIKTSLLILVIAPALFLF